MGEITTVGRVLLKSRIPSDLRGFIDNTVFDSKGIGLFFEELSKRSPEVYKATVSNLTRLGFEVSTRQGSSVGLKDLVSPVNKVEKFAKLDKEIQEVKKGPGSKAEKEMRITSLYEKFADNLNKEIVEEGLKKNHTLAKVITSGSRGSPTQYRQTVATPVLVVDAKGKPMLDFPIRSSFAEGLSLPEYLAHSYGVRTGAISTKLSVASAGFLSKQLSRATMTIQVEEHDCGTQNGIPVSTEDKDSIGSFLAKEIGGYKRNNEVTGKMLNDLRNRNISTVLLRSPIACQSSRKFHSGAVCQLCAGKRERRALPHIGDYIGITASTTLGERLSQGSLNVKHTAASARKAHEVGGFKLINQLFNIPKTFQGKAALAFHDGIVTEIKPAAQGGYYVYVGNEEHYVSTGLELKIKKGDRVEAGDVLSEGIVNPAEIVKFKGIGEGRRFFSESMQQTFKDAGMPISRRNFEVISKNLIDHVRVTASHGLGDFLPDQIVSYQLIEKDYRPRVGAKEVRADQAYNKYLEEPILHYTIGTRLTHKVLEDLKKNGIDSITVHEKAPGFVPEMQRLLDVPVHEQDWMHQLYSTYLEKRFLNAVNVGATSNIAGPSPIPGIAYGADFGLKRVKPIKKASEVSAWEDYDRHRDFMDIEEPVEETSKAEE